MKKKKKEEEVDEGWLLPYSDMLTLLLALFIVLFAMAKVDDKKFQQIKTEFNSILSTRSGTGSDSIIGTKAVVKQEQGKTSSSEAHALAQEAKTQRQLETKQLEAVKQQLQADFTQANLQSDVTVTLQSDGIHITMNSNALFASGSADLTPEVQQSLEGLSPHLQVLSNNPVIIAGYTDNVPIRKNGRFASNWNLSAERAISVMNFFVSKKVFSENNVSIQAYGENKPKASNDTSDGRAQNRRVEVIIQRINN
ncbi:OmpA family protein [Liquorilactobacillus uvarum]|uniref:OmpA family protein n=1 Tax=Liquorilactobacillus uvarum TaxID=303240 RepID=UPI00288905A6|nr:OmpA family protein [Liquorilactobacillus uvarum]